MILVELRHDAGTAAVYRDDQGAWLTGSLGHGGTLIEGARPAAEGIGQGFVAGGLMPDGATRAFVEGEPARTGGGAWIAIIPSLEPAVRFETDAGEIVRPPLPADWAREPVTDADTACPACGGATWERVTPADKSRGSRSTAGGWEPMPVLVCTRCGHEVSEGAWMTFDQPASPEALQWHEEQHRARDAMLLDIPFPVYALEDPPQPPALGAWGGDSLTVRHGAAIEVESELGDGWDDDVRHALIRALADDEPPPDVSQPAMALWLDRRRREHDARAAAAEPFAISLPVDGETVRFEGARSGDAWAASGRVGDVRVTVVARQFAADGIRLRRVADPARELAT